MAAAKPAKNTRLAGVRFVGLEASCSMLPSGVGASLMSLVKVAPGVNGVSPVSRARGSIIIVKPASMAKAVYRAMVLFILPRSSSCFVDWFGAFKPMF